MGNRSVEHYHIHFIPGRLQGKFIRCMLQGQGFPIEAEVKIKK
jgi:diadenosine tetraphosphate (Ap4A) HIT family hydrolase